VHPKIVQELLGHATITITLDTNSHMLPNMQYEVVSAMEVVLSWRVTVQLQEIAPVALPGRFPFSRILRADRGRARQDSNLRPAD
jgi:hypothetical protein